MFSSMITQAPISDLLSQSFQNTTNFIRAADWEMDSDNRWTVLFGGGVGKIFRIGDQPLNGQVSRQRRETGFRTRLATQTPAAVSLSEIV